MTLLVTALYFATNPPTMVAPWAERGVTFWERARDALGTWVDAAGAQVRTDLATGASATPPPERQVQAAWQRARQAGAYRFATRIVQTTHPAPKIANVGDGSRVERAYLEGETDLSAHTLLLRLWPNGDGVTGASNSLELRIERDRAYGRAGDGAWQEMDNVADAFAPANDALTYLAGAKT